MRPRRACPGARVRYGRGVPSGPGHRMNAHRSSQLADIPAPDASPGRGHQGWLRSEHGSWHGYGHGLLLVSMKGALRLQSGTASAVVVPGLAAAVSADTPFRVDAPQGAHIWWLWTPAATDCGAGLRSFVEAPLLGAAARCRTAWSSGDAVAQALTTALVGLMPGWCASTPPLTLPRAQDQRMQSALDWLGARLERPVGLADAARAAGLADRTFQRRCRMELGLSLTAWLTRARMLRAVAQLAETDAPIADVALRCGYQSPAAFTRAFTGLVGVTPSAWRARSRTA